MGILFRDDEAVFAYSEAGVIICITVLLLIGNLIEDFKARHLNIQLFCTFSSK